MNVLLSPQPSLFPHQHDATRLSPPRTFSPHANMSNRKRKADDNGDEMSVSPAGSPAISNRQLARPSKKVRALDITGRPLSLPRLLETLDVTQLRTVLQTIGERHPELGQEIVNSAPRPTVPSALQVLREYRERLQNAIPFGSSSGDYSYYRVKPYLLALLDAISDFTPQYLPPIESQPGVSVEYLDGATKLIHSLPDWDGAANRQHKENAYEEMARAWALVISEAAKRGGGILLSHEHWDQKLIEHNQKAGGRLQYAVDAMENHLSWVRGSSSPSQGNTGPPSILNDILSGAYSSPVRAGW